MTENSDQDYVTALLANLKVEGVQLRTKERNSDKAAQKRRRARRKAKVVRRERVRARKAAQGRTGRSDEGSHLHGLYNMLCRGYALKYRKALAKGHANPERHPMRMTEDEFIMLWLEAGSVNLGPKASSPAWKLKGRNTSLQAHMRRVDKDLGWTLENTEVVYRGVVLASGKEVRRIYFSD